MSETESSLPNPFDNNNILLQHAEADISIGDTETLQREKEIDTDKPNFPFFFPVVHHNIDHDISPFYTQLIKTAYYTALSFSISLIFQFIGSFFNSNTNKWATIFLAFVQMIALPMLLFHVQYFPLYNVIKVQEKDFCLPRAQLLIIFIFLLVLIGIPSSGAIGIASTIMADTGVETFFGVVLSLWHGIDFLCELYLYAKMKPILTQIHEMDPTD